MGARSGQLLFALVDLCRDERSETHAAAAAKGRVCNSIATDLDLVRSMIRCYKLRWRQVRLMERILSFESVLNRTIAHLLVEVAEMHVLIFCRGAEQQSINHICSGWNLDGR